MSRPDDHRRVSETLLTEDVPLTGSARETIRGAWLEEEEAEPETETLQLGAPIARGGMGWIRQAHQPGIERRVAVKSLLPGERRPGAAAALLQEARLTGQLEHPNIVPVHDLRASEEGPLMVMKHIEGESWEALIAAGAPLDRHLEVAMALCQALHFAHRQGVVHCDIKPANVMVGEFGEVYLLDWGVAREVPASSRRALLGTPAYMAPEMAEPEGVISPRTDVFLLGASLQEALSGQPRNPATALQEALAQAREVAATRWPPEVPAELASICDRACARQPADRFEDAMALREALAEFLQHRSSVASSTAAGEQLALLRQRVSDGDRGDSAILKVHRHYSACRFGFEQALREWPESPEARAGLQEVLEVMIRFELSSGSPRSAAPLLAELPQPRPELAAAVQAALAQRRDAAEQLAELQREARIQGQDWGRSLVTVVNGFLSAGLLLGLWAVSPPLEAISQRSAMIFLAGCVVAQASGTLVFRRYLLSNRIYVRLMIVLSMLCPLMLLNHGLSWLMTIPVHHSFLTDCIICCAMNVTLAAALDRVFWVSSMIAVVTTLLIALDQTAALPMVAAAYALNSFFLAWILRPQDG